MGSNDMLCYIGVPDPSGKGKIRGSNPHQNMQLQIAVKLPILCCHLVNPNNERFRLLPHYFGPCYYGSTEYKYPILFIEYVQNTE